MVPRSAVRYGTPVTVRLFVPALLALCLGACGARQTPPPEGATSPGTVTASPAAGPSSTDRAVATARDQVATPGGRLRRAPACSYLSVDEVSGILKGPIGKPAEKEADATSSCGYPPLDMTSYQQAQIDIEWHAAGTSTLEDQMAQTFGGNAVGSQVAHHLRLGDSSSYSREGILRIHAGEALISITLIMRPDSEQKAVALGQLLLGRMGYSGPAAAGATAPGADPAAGVDSAAQAAQPPNGSEVTPGIVLADQCAAPDAPGKAALHQSAQDEKAALVPLKVGLTVVFTWTKGITEPEDYECLEQVASVTDSYVDFTESCAEANGKRSHNQRRVCRQDLLKGHVYHPSLWPDAPAVISPTTLLSLSSNALRELKTAGQTLHRLLELYPHPTRVQAVQLSVDTTLVADPAAPKTYPILVNDRLVQLPVVTSRSKKTAPAEDDDDDTSPILKQIQASVLSDGPPQEDPQGNGINAIVATTLDDERFPLMLDYEIPAKNYRVRLNKITYGAEQEMEKQLAAQEEVTVYGIYFDFASDKLRPESKPVLDEIAGILAKNPDWKLSVTGHTDGVGGAASNLDLSKRRAAAVKATLVEQYQVAASRLTTDGVGAGAPQDTNETPEGRARNRRVVLRRVL